MKNCFIDFFKLNDYQEVNIAELKRVMVFTSTNETNIDFRQYEVNGGTTVNITDVSNQNLKMNEIGPRFSLAFRRDQIASADLYKEACKHPKDDPTKAKNKKNMFTDEFGQQKGKVFLQHQDTSTLVTRKWKKQTKPKSEIKTDEV